MSQSDINERYIVNSYIDFVNISNQSIHEILEIINTQQSSFNNILQRYNINPSRHRSSISNLSTQNRTSSTLPLSERNRAIRRLQMPPITLVSLRDYDTNNLNIPSQTEIDNAIERINFCDISNPINNSCPISQIDFSANDRVIRLKECQHIFSEPHILQWFERNSLCPLCRYNIRNADLSLNSQTYNSNTSLPFAQQLANIITNQITSQPDFSGNINIDLDVS